MLFYCGFDFQIHVLKQCSSYLMVYFNGIFYLKQLTIILLVDKSQESLEDTRNRIKVRVPGMKRGQAGTG